MRKTIFITLLLSVVFIVPAQADWDWVESFFDVVVNDKGAVTSGEGYGGGATGPDPGGYYDPIWYHYDNTDWWNVWFYDHPFDPSRVKLVDISCLLVATGPGAWATVAINYSTDIYPIGEVVPPLPPIDPAIEDEQIGRYILCENINLEACGGMFDLTCGPFELPVPYNPEWISVDIRGVNFSITGGSLKHACVPEPATMALLGLGAMLVLKRHKK